MLHILVLTNVKLSMVMCYIYVDHFVFASSCSYPLLTFQMIRNHPDEMHLPYPKNNIT